MRYRHKKKRSQIWNAATATPIKEVKDAMIKAAASSIAMDKWCEDLEAKVQRILAIRGNNPSLSGTT